jgi:hypothetical protein
MLPITLFRRPALPFGGKDWLVSKAPSHGNPAAIASASLDNVIQLPLPQKDESASPPVLFADAGSQQSADWLIEEQVKPEANKAKAKKRVAGGGAKKPATTRKSKPGAAKKPKTSRAPKRAATAKRASSIAKRSVPDAATTAVDETAPLERARAPVVWRKSGPLDVVRFWLRTAGSSLTAMLSPRQRKRAAINVVDPRLRTRKELLVEVAILRQENAAMRKKLGLPSAPFGRQVADRI